MALEIEINEDRLIDELKEEIGDVFGVCDSASCTLGLFNKSDGSLFRIGLIVEEIDPIDGDEFLYNLDIVQVSILK